jgi:osmotically-inducible protein OsmY
VDVQNLVENSSLLSSNKNIQVSLDQGTVVLRGSVGTDRERRLAEGTVRLNGARLVRNELRVAP